MVAEISDAGLELHHCAGFSFERAAARQLDRPRCSRRRNVRLLRRPGRDARSGGDRATRPLNDRSLGHWPIIYESGPPMARRPRRRNPISAALLTEIAGFFLSMFHRSLGDETILQGTKPFSAFVADIRKQPLVI